MCVKRSAFTLAACRLLALLAPGAFLPHAGANGGTLPYGLAVNRSSGRRLGSHLSGVVVPGNPKPSRDPVKPRP